MLSSIYVIKLLSPDDFGLISVGMILITILRRFETMGINTAIVQKDEVNDVEYSTGFVVKLFVSGLLLLLAYGIAPFWASFYDAEPITKIVRLLSLTLIISSFTFLPRIQLERNVRFQKTVMPEIIGKIANAGLTIVLAFWGYGYMSIVWGTLGGSFVKAVLFNLFNPVAYRFSFDWQAAKQLLGFGKWVILTSLLYWAYSYLDNAFIGKMLGTAALGFYAIAFRWGKWYSDNVQHVLSRALFPTFSRIQNDKAKIKKSYLKLLAFNSILLIPFSLALCFLSEDFVLIVFGSKWSEAILPLQLLSIGGMFASLNAGGSVVFLALGQPKFDTKVITINFIITVIGLYPATVYYGINGVALLVSLSYLASCTFVLVNVSRLLQISFGAYLKSWGLPLLASIAMVICLYFTKSHVPKTIPGFLGMIMIGMITYFGSILILTKGTLIKEIRKLLNR